MRYCSYLKSPKREEQDQEQDTVATPSFRPSELALAYNANEESEGFMEGFLGTGDDESLSNDNNQTYQSWEDFMDWEEQLDDGDDHEEDINNSIIGEYKSLDFGNLLGEETHYISINSTSKVIKKEMDVGFWDIGNYDVKGSLKLNLNYQDVLDAWSDRGPLRAQSCSSSLAANEYYTGEVPVMDEERTRREASVLRYKEKRQSRLFSKKIRYQVRKLNADKRPRLKGRFVKRTS